MPTTGRPTAIGRVGEGERVEMGYRAGRQDLATKPQVPERARIVEEPSPAANQDNGHHDGKDQVARSGYESAAARPC